MARLKYTGPNRTTVGSEGPFVAPGQVVDLELHDQAIAKLLSTGEWERLDGQVTDREIQIFISHSSRDAELAKAVIGLVERALPIPRHAIRCTSVDGYRLPAGASIDDSLRAEVQDAALVLALLTPSAVESMYVMFEIGARWGSRKPLIPLLASGLAPGDLKPPLSGIYAVNCAEPPQVARLASEVAARLGVTPKATTIQAEVDRVSEVSRQASLDKSLANLTQTLVDAALKAQKTRE